MPICEVIAWALSESTKFGLINFRHNLSEYTEETSLVFLFIMIYKIFFEFYLIHLVKLI